MQMYILLMSYICITAYQYSSAVTVYLVLVNETVLGLRLETVRVQELTLTKGCLHLAVWVCLFLFGDRGFRETAVAILCPLVSWSEKGPWKGSVYYYRDNLTFAWHSLGNQSSCWEDMNVWVIY